ncbi:MAG: hypothetical protein R3Y53_00950 [Bacillota bacterium]
MLDFKEELSKYQPILELDEIQNSLQPSQLKDLMDVLEYIAATKHTDSIQQTNQ